MLWFMRGQLIYLFTCSSFNNSVSDSDYTAIGYDDDKLDKAWKDIILVRFWVIPSIIQEDCEKPQKPIARIVNVPDKLQIISLLNASQKHSVVASLFHKICSGIVLWYTEIPSYLHSLSMTELFTGKMKTEISYLDSITFSITINLVSHHWYSGPYLQM
jgi:hypothetical protein